MHPARSGRSTTVRPNRWWGVSGAGISISARVGKASSKTRPPNGRPNCASSITSRSIDERKILFPPNRANGQRMARAVLVPHGCHRTGDVRAVLHPLLCADGAADQCIGEGGVVGCLFRTGQDGAVWRPDHPRRRRNQTIKSVSATKETKMKANGETVSPDGYIVLK